MLKMFFHTEILRTPTRKSRRKINTRKQTSAVQVTPVTHINKTTYQPMKTITLRLM